MFFVFRLDVVDSVGVAGDSPNEQVLVSVVLAWFAVPPLCALVNNLHNLVHEDYNFILKTFSSLCKLANPANAEHKLNSFALVHEVKARVYLHEGRRDDICAEFPESSLKQRANFKDREFKHLCFHLQAGLFLLDWVDWLLERVLSESLDNFNNLLNWFDYDAFSVVAENDECCREDAASKYGGQQLKDGVHSGSVALVNSCICYDLLTTFKLFVCADYGGECDERHLLPPHVTVIRDNRP